MNRVVHFKKSDHDFYVGRPSNWGNPFTHKRGTQADVVLDSREDAVDAFRKWLAGEEYQDVEPKRRQWILDNVHLLEKKILGCWCYPKQCHAEILRDLADGKSIKTIDKKVKKETEFTKLF